MMFSPSLRLPTNVAFGSTGMQSFGQPDHNGKYNAVISYHTSDKQQALELAKKLHTQGLSIILSEAPAALLDRANHTIALMSVQYMGTITGNKALTQAIEKRLLQGQGRLLPVKLEECVTHPLLEDIQPARLYGTEKDQQEDRLVRSLKKFEHLT